MSKFQRIGITGGIAAGKSTVSNHLRALGYDVLDYDEIARKVVEPGSPVLEEIHRVFGPQSIGVDGSLNRQWLALHVFNNAEKLQHLDNITHPAVYAFAAEYESKLRSQGSTVVFHDIPLLVETRHIAAKHGITYDHILTIEADESIRIRRMIDERHMSEEQARARIQSQLSRKERESVANGVIDSSLPLKDMLNQVDRIIAAWLKA